MNQVQSKAHNTLPADTTASRCDDEYHLTAYNSAFTELGLRFRWDAGMYRWLCRIECEKTRVARYIEEHHAHLLKAYSADFLSQLIFDKKNEYLRAREWQAN